MDRVQRAYAHTAWTPSDPLAGLEPHVRRAILLMPSTFRERFKLAPWVSRLEKRQAVVEILAERRLLYELTVGHLESEPPRAVAADMAPAVTASGAPLSPYYRRRLQHHRLAMDGLAESRAEQDRFDEATRPEARAELQRRIETRHAWLALEQRRLELDRDEMKILDERPMVSPLAAQRSAEWRSRRDRRDR